MNPTKALLSCLILFLSLIIPAKHVMAQDRCDCSSELTWVKNTFEKNDAGFGYILNEKGQKAYEDHTALLMHQAKDIRTKNDCKNLIYNWLRFFRKGHIGVIVLNEEKQSVPILKLDSNKIRNHETLGLDERRFQDQIAKQHEPSPIGVWESSPYKVGIVPTDSGYSGVLLDAPGTPWKKDQIKFKLYPDGDSFRATLWFRDFSVKENVPVHFIGNNIIHIEGMSFFLRKSRKFEDKPLVKNYINYLYTHSPYYEQLSVRTGYLRIPSFAMSNKTAIDSVLRTHHENIINAHNLIIDLRNNGGGSDWAYSSLIPYIYTNPIRTVGVELLSTELNNMAVLELSQDTLYGEKQRAEFKETYERLNADLGNFVRVREANVTVDSMDSILPNPLRVAILVNEYCASTTEQFLLEAKQSSKVKLYGSSTFGALDFSNMTSAISPSGEFQLWYCRSKSLRIPGMEIDGSGIQPDYYLDPSISQKDWVGFVLDTIEQNILPFPS
ncbi:S41 family peptidase [Sphingobacterium sp. SYP-B4668]|uniref:S41 family peptidase n=1 Tax=Sphingobacterium sp. SYP-B4668 TaxID=2996035 RepID=UPI0022DE1FC2|nr:S41 family peptidase [Sphingobacterium sp. SYP-B4668]